MLWNELFAFIELLFYKKIKLDQVILTVLECRGDLIHDVYIAYSGKLYRQGLLRSLEVTNIQQLVLLRSQTFLKWKSKSKWLYVTVNRKCKVYFS